MNDYKTLYNKAVRLRREERLVDAYDAICDCIQYIDDHKRIDDIECAIIGNNYRTMYTIEDLGNKSRFIQNEAIKIYGTAGQIAAELDLYEEAHKFYSIGHQWEVYSLNGYQSTNSLFSFRAYKAFSLCDIINNTINVARPSKMNDPFDTFLFEWFEVMKDRHPDKKYIDCRKQSYQGYRIRSFVSCNEKSKAPYENSIMWANYADEHQGFCIEYDFSQEFCKDNMSFEKIIYKDINLMKDNISIEGLLATKSSEWSREDEIRLISYDDNIQGDFATIPLDSGSHIKAIYFGLRCSNQIQDCIAKVTERDSVHLYKMGPRTNEQPYLLKAIQIR